MDPRSTEGAVVLTTGTVERRPFWMNRDELPTAAWLHTPVDGLVRPGGVVVCPSFGFEYAHAHRTLLHLADLLAERGFAVLRLDYPGTGDSAGDESTPDLVEAWLNAIRAGKTLVERLTGGDAPAALVGLRLGALLGGVVATQEPVGGFVAWAPVTRGRAFVREIRALDLMGGEAHTDDGYIEGGGFRLSAETSEALAELNLLKLDRIRTDEALVIDRTDQPGAERLADRLAESCAVAREEQDDYLDMMAEPHFTRVPESTLARIVEWSSRVAGGSPRPLDGSVLRRAVDARSARVGAGSASPVARETGAEDASAADHAAVEEHVAVGAPDDTVLYGILARPVGTVGKSVGTVVLLPNAGSPHHVGPNRLYVELARDLATRGIASFRFDLRNLGDSRIRRSEDENHPYPDTATEDVGIALDGLGGAFDRNVLAGLCAGAHTAFHAGHELPDAPIARVISINPLTYRYVPGMSLRTPSSYRTTQDAIYYRQALLSSDRWKRLFSGRSNLSNVTSFVARWVRQTLFARVRNAARALHLAPPTELERDLEALKALGRHVRFVFSSTDPGHDVLRRQAGATVRRLTRRGALSVTIIPDADHTFSRKIHREAAIAAVREAAAAELA